MFLRKKLSREG